MSPAANTRAHLPAAPIREKLTREALAIIAVLIGSTFNVILDEILMVVTAVGDGRLKPCVALSADVAKISSEIALTRKCQFKQCA